VPWSTPFEDPIRSSRGTNERADLPTSKVFADAAAAEAWFEENDPEGVAFDYEILE
jgi:hypothetical protein